MLARSLGELRHKVALCSICLVPQRPMAAISSTSQMKKPKCEEAWRLPKATPLKAAEPGH